MGFLVVQICMVIRLLVGDLLDLRKCHGFRMQEMNRWRLASSRVRVGLLKLVWLNNKFGP